MIRPEGNGPPEKHGTGALLLTPGADGFVGLVWVLPVAGLIMALAGLAAVFRKWQIAPAPPTPDDADRDLVAAALAED